MADLTTLSDGDLEAMHRNLMEQRAEADMGFKKQLREVGAELDRRAATVRAAMLADTLSEADKEALRQHLGLGQ